MDMPKPGPEHRALERLAGHWVGEETIHPGPFDPAGGTARAEVTNTMAVAGFALVQDYAQERGGAVSFRGHGILRWDAAAGEYAFYWVDSFGMPPSEYRGKLVDDVLSMSYAGPMGLARAVWTLVGSDRYDYRMEVSGDSGASWHPFMEGAYRRA